MIEIISEFKWHLLIGLEILFWITLSIFLLLRYWFKAPGQLFFLTLTVLNEFLNLPLAVIDYLYTGKLETYQFVVLLFFIYALTYGQRDIQKFDGYIQNKVADWKDEDTSRINDDMVHKTFYGKGRARFKRKKLYGHVLVFLAVHVGFLFFSNETTGMISSFWIKILIIDTIWSLSYTIRPKISA